MKTIGHDITKFLKHVFRVCLTRVLPPTFFLGWLLLIFLTPPGAANPEKFIVYFYSSETNINTFKSLKMEFDSYLAKFGDYEFQPFSDRKTFEEQVKDKPRCLVLLSSWHYANIHKAYVLKPMLVGVRNGQKYQKRILVASESAANIESVKTGPIASASSAQHTLSTLGEMFKDQDPVKNFKILTVPKDIDALMSVGFGMAKSALITENSLETLKTVNPPLYKKLKIVAESKESLLLIIAAPESFVTDAEKMIGIIQNMSTDPDGEKKIKMLGLEGWQTFDPSDESKVEG